MKSILKWVSYMIFIVGIVFSSRGYSAEQQSKVIFVLFDLSDSTKKDETRKRYL